MLWHAVRAVCRPPVESVFVVLAAGDEVFARQDWSALPGKVAPLFCGGGTRRDSVYNGLGAMMGALNADDWVLVHDAARPGLAFWNFQELLDETRNEEAERVL